MNKPKPFRQKPDTVYTPLQNRSVHPVHELTTDQLQELLHFLTDKWYDKKRIEGVIRVMKSKLQ